MIGDRRLDVGDHPRRLHHSSGDRHDDGDDALYFFRLSLLHEDMHQEAGLYMAQGLGLDLGDLPGAQAPRLPAPPVLPALVDKNFEALCGDFIHKHQSHCGQAPGAERLTRFLCGISVPLFTRLKARAIPGFAALEDYPYAEVRAWAQSHLATGASRG